MGKRPVLVSPEEADDRKRRECRPPTRSGPTSKLRLSQRPDAATVSPPAALLPDPPNGAHLPLQHPRRLGAAVFVAALAAAALAATSGAMHRAPHIEGPGTVCGGTLWRLMTLSDRARYTVNLHGEPTTIPKVAELQGPAHIGRARSTAFQRRVWRMHAVIDRYRMASNGEIVLVLYDIDSGMYMNAYFPSPQCLGKRARDRTGMVAARRELVSHCPAPSIGWQLLGVTVDLGGVGFWNPSTGTRGALRNGAELRPLTNFKIVSGCGVP